MTALTTFDSRVREWAAGRNGWIRAPLLLWLAWVLARHWDDPHATTIFQGIDLAFHEIGHILWAPLGEFMAIAGGTLTQVLAPAAAGAVLYRQRDWFGVAFAIGWMGIACFETVLYAGDAVARRLPLVSPTTAEPIHDWAYLLARLDMLEHTRGVARAWQWAGRILMGIGILFGGRVLWHMATAGSGGPDPAMAEEEARFREHLTRIGPSGAGTVAAPGAGTVAAPGAGTGTGGAPGPGTAAASGAANGGASPRRTGGRHG